MRGRVHNQRCQTAPESTQASETLQKGTMELIIHWTHPSINVQSRDNHMPVT